VLKINVKIIAGGVTKKSINVPNESTYEDLLRGLKINEETVVVIKDEMPQPIDCKVSDGEITVMRVVSGG